ncbi:LAQU0S03e08020g1_1 [Lachancea quebecensis]|uniref:LAQU0S03e08020g1_1 n=1 Tax=Lachancea quebecensis TaxID=1654605 RepID=A0A0P1KPH8_9SACH|nr:LAQU0S03e08020g1_1 [Lachancea quebecensis]
MNRIFGYGGRKNHEQLLQDSNKAMNEAQQSMQQRISGIDTQISQLNVQLQAIQRKISSTKSAAGQKPLRQRALKLLNKRKQLEGMRDSLDSQSWSMNQAQMTSDNLRNTMVTVNALKQTNKALKAQYGKINVDKLQDMQDEMLDLVEQGEELQQVLAMGSGAQDIDDISETELDAELEALGDDQLYGEMNFETDTAGEIPSYLSGTVPQFVDEEPLPETEGKLETAT